jgi:hypothetical protein
MLLITSMMTTTRTIHAMTGASRGRWAFALTLAASIWALGLIPAAFVVPVYGTQSSSSGLSPTVTHGGATLVAVNGAGAPLIVLIALPAAFAILAGFGLHRVCAVGSRAGRRLAIAAIGVLAALTLLTGFSIGVAMVPALLLLVVAVRLTPSGSPPAVS